MATTATTTNNSNNYELDYSPPGSTQSSLKHKSSANIATAMVINPNINYHYINTTNTNQSTMLPLTETSADSGFDLTATPTSVNNIASQINSLNISPLSSKELLQQNIGFFGAGSSNIGYSASLMSSAQYTAGLENKCLRCSNQVYALERIGPIKGNIYHKTCFKCLICERQLDLKTYYTNQVDLNDRQIYCQSHAPKCGKGIFGADSIYIHNVLNAPKLDVMQKVDNKPKVIRNLIF